MTLENGAPPAAGGAPPVVETQPDAQPGVPPAGEEGRFFYDDTQRMGAGDKDIYGSPDAGTPPPADGAPGGGTPAPGKQADGSTPPGDTPPPDDFVGFKPDERAHIEALMAKANRLPEDVRAEVTGIVDGLKRLNADRDAGVQKFIQEELGPLKEIAQNELSTGLVRLYFEDQEMLEIAALLADARYEHKANGKPWEPVATLTEHLTKKNGAPPAGGKAPTIAIGGDFDKFLTMDKEDFAAEVAADPGIVQDLVKAIINKYETALTQVNQKVEPVARRAEVDSAKDAAQKEFEGFVNGRPKEFQDLPESERGKVLAATNAVYQSKAQEWAARGYSPLARLEIAYAEAWGQYKAGLAAEAEKARGGEAQRRAVASDSPRGSQRPTIGGVEYDGAQSRKDIYANP